VLILAAALPAAVAVALAARPVLPPVTPSDAPVRPDADALPAAPGLPGDQAGTR
jgi:hypothetical protein